MRIFLLVTVMVAHHTNAAGAGGLALESNAGPRDKASAAILRPVFDELARLGYRGGPRSVGAPYEASLSRPSRVGDGLPADFIARVDEAYQRWIGGDFPAGIAALAPLVALAHDNAADIVGNAKIGAAVFKAHIGLAMCQHRLGKAAEARATLAEVVRSFEAEVTKGQYGSEAYGLYQEVKKAVRAQPTGSLKVSVIDSATVVYVNERFAVAGALERSDLSPGTYRVMAQLGPHFGRVYRVEIKPGAVAELRVNPEVERAVVTGPEWTGLAFRDRAERERNEVEYAAEIGSALAEAGVVIVGSDTRKGKPFAYASLINATTGLEVRRASVEVASLPPAERLRALARFVVQGGDPSEGVEKLELARRQPKVARGAQAPIDDPPRSMWSTRRKVALGVFGVGVAAAVTGVVLGRQAQGFEEDAFALCPNPGAGCADSDRAEELLDKGHQRSVYSVVSYGVAGAAVVAAGALWIFGAPARPDEATARILPRFGGGREGGYAGLELLGRF